MPRKMRPAAAIFALSILLAGMSGCWNGDVTNTSLGDVSLGQQLLDLKAAFEQGAIDEEEYEQARRKFLSLLDGCDCESGNGEDADDEE